MILSMQGPGYSPAGILPGQTAYIGCTGCRGKELVTQLYHTTNVDERQNGADHQRPFHSDAEDSS